MILQNVPAYQRASVKGHFDGYGRIYQKFNEILVERSEESTR